jgi:hypothetical protein
MPAGLLPLLTAHLWDLRAQCETQIRALTEAQRQIDALRATGDNHARADAVEKFRANLARVVRVNDDILATVRIMIQQAKELTPSGTPTPTRVHREAPASDVRRSETTVPSSRAQSIEHE